MLDDGSVLPFGKRLRQLLEARGPDASQAWLATRSGLDRSLISRVIRGNREPTLEALQCLAPALGVDLAELVRGTTAEERLREGEGLVRRADYEEAVKSLIEYEQKNRDLDARVRSLNETLEREQHARRVAEESGKNAAVIAERASGRLKELETLHAAQTAELLRYQRALARAVADFSELKKRVGDLQNELGEAKKSSRTASILAGVAAVTGVATIAHFLGDDELDQYEKQPSAKRRAR
ncbi:helix-turn-helix transcriptional regulator [Sorangium sp. So ce327]|uniref:helix-turn-helix domain-containing protein n=1 Tax=Sorangium sp. So ce327 TaxID=3133301 RepID=UPI003F6375D6